MKPMTETTLAMSRNKDFDPEFEVRYTVVADIIQSWTAQYLDVSSADVLDFGCGEGITALGFARRFQAKSVSAVDIMPDVRRCLDRSMQNLGLPLPANLQARQIAPAEDFMAGKKFDLIYSWSVFEHIEQTILDEVIAQIASRLKPGGLLFTQIAPLFYAADGSHLAHRIPEPWAHLTMQGDLYLKRLTEACTRTDERDALWACFSTLNKLTAPELKRRLDRTGMTLLREYTSENADSGEPPSALLEVFTREALMTNQVVLLHQNTR
jgi:2-polyprenyl-3-methyl-5-hydroxy-6-metoxy-1,4-benzoquinol methylase